MNKIAFIFSIMIIFSLVSCGSGKDSTKQQVYSKDAVPPTAALIEALIIDYDTTHKYEPGTICAEHPCLAKIKISRIMAKGEAFEGEIYNGQTTSVQFPLTLSPTDEIEIQSEFSNPGALPGSRIMAYIHTGEEYDRFTRPSPYYIYNYVLLNGE